MNKRYILSLFLFCLCAAVFAQKLPEFRVVSFEKKPFDLSARDERYKIVDGNGSLFSIIKLASNNSNDDLMSYSFDFGFSESRIKEVDGEVWVYVQRNAEHVTIKREGYRTVKYELNTTVQSGEVFEMVLSAEAKKVYREILEFNIEPADAMATVFVKSSAPGAQYRVLGIVQDGRMARSLELGTYYYQIVSDRFHSSEGIVELKEDKGKHIETVRLRPNFSIVRLVAGEGVDIYINDEKVGTDTWTGELSAGSYNVECHKKNHKSTWENITITDSEEQTINLRSPSPITGTLTVISQPLGAKIIIDGKDYGETPQTIENLPIGTHSVEITKENYRSEQITVEIREDETSWYDIALKGASSVTITSAPDNADLYIGSKKVGTTPYTFDVLPGEYDLRIAKNGYNDFKKRVYLDSSEPQLSYTLLRRYQKMHTGYIEVAGQLGTLSGFGVNLGGYIHNFNIEGYGTFGLSKAGVYINYTDGNMPNEEKLSASLFGGKFGYGIILNNRFRLTPQVGAGVIVAKGEMVKAAAVTASVALRCECVIINHLGVSLTPEYSFAISKKPVFENLSAVSPKINRWATGFNARIGLYYYF